MGILVVVCNCNARHRSAENCFFRCGTFSAAVIDYSGNGSADLNPKVFGLSHGFTRNGQNPLVKGLAKLYGFAYRVAGCNVLYYDANVRRELAETYLASRSYVDKLLFAAHRVLLAQFYDLYIFVRFESGYSVGLVGFYADNNLLNAQRFGEKSCTARYFVRLFNHKTVVAGKVRLALRAVYDKSRNGGFGRNFNRRGEACSA